jgi:hypothetical protein
MDGKYLASNIGPLKVIGDGKAFITINDLLNSNQFEDAELVAYSIRDYESRIVNVDCLFNKFSSPTERNILFFRSFDYYKRNESIVDDLKLTAEYGIGFADFEMERFIEIRDFYLQYVEVKA